MRIKTAVKLGFLAITLIFIIFLFYHNTEYSAWDVWDPGFSHASETRMTQLRNNPLFHSIESLADVSSDIVRAEIVSIWEDSIAFGDTIEFSYIFDIYKLNIIDVYKGDVHIGGTIDVMQLKEYAKRDYTGFFVRADARNRFSKAPLEIGDDLVLFLLRPNEQAGRLSFEDGTIPYILVNPHQSAYRYNSSEDVVISENTMHESISSRFKRFQLTLTEEQLVQFRLPAER